MDMSLFSMYGLDYLFRWIHFMAGVTWIGLLYYFNFVQTEYFKEAEDAHRTGAVQKLVPRALWWFRWGAMFTFLTGVAMLMYRHTGLTYDITVGSVLGILMFLNVWLIIWPNQKVVIAGLPEAVVAAPKATLASRTNTLFSAPMLFFMGSSTHFSSGMLMSADKLGLTLVMLIILALEMNAIFGKLGPLESVRGVIGCSIGLTAVLYGIMTLV